MSNIQTRFGVSADDAERDLQTQRTAYADECSNEVCDLGCEGGFKAP